ncbi:MAG: hypothetical protein E6J91_10785 [Deltaproteobacteria bacterium]|nr:MAG: hypothetical protein E6J91_10785 [Deltaproteobacteria bacterium]
MAARGQQSRSRQFAKRIHVNDLYQRKTNRTTEYWTRPELPGKKLADQPAFVLTSSRTFSGAEEFTYNLKNLKRATIVGEATGGGAHPTAGRRLDDHFMIGVPFARAVTIDERQRQPLCSRLASSARHPRVGGVLQLRLPLAAEAASSPTRSSPATSSTAAFLPTRIPPM